MNANSDAMPDSRLESQAIAPASAPPTQPFYWSLRREVWENRSLYVAPLAVAALALFAFTISVTAGIWVQPLRLDPAHPQVPLDLVAGMLMLTSILVSVFYCLDALHGERRDRSILFWKSLPVSDRTTVLVKASIPLAILPLFVFAVTLVVQFVMMLISSLVLPASGLSVAAYWSNLSLVQMWLLLLYHILTAHAIWPAPIYCWLLLVSGWARRAPFLWAVLPLVVIAGLEGIAFHTWHFASLVGRRFIGDSPSMAHTAGTFPTNPMTHITPWQFLISPGLWLGLALAVVFIAAAIRLRRYQGPI